MATESLHHSPSESQRSGNLDSGERWLSALVGLGLAVRAVRGPGLIGRLLLASAGASMLARSVTGYCAMKSALAGETTLREGLKEQLHRLTAGVSGGAGGEIDDMEVLYITELQELYSAEGQLAALVERLGPTLQNAGLAVRIDAYATELRARKTDLENLLTRWSLDKRAHPDDAMRALLNETDKMARLCGPGLRDAAIVASLQRIIHYKIAGYGTIAAYAKALNQTQEAAHFAQLADRDKTVDAELSDLAKKSLNPEAAVVPEEKRPAGEKQPGGAARTH